MIAIFNEIIIMIHIVIYISIIIRIEEIVESSYRHCRYNKYKVLYSVSYSFLIEVRVVAMI